jgi:hypothetical protein
MKIVISRLYILMCLQLIFFLRRIMKSFVFLLLFIGVILVVSGYIKSDQQCPPSTVEYRYVPQTFEQEQDLDKPVLSIFGKMFKDNSAWVQANGYADQTSIRKLRGEVDTEFIS